MDRETIEKVTRLVVESLVEMKQNGIFPKQYAVKIWPHQTPLPAPIVMANGERQEHEVVERMITISRYV